MLQIRDTDHRMYKAAICKITPLVHLVHYCLHWLAWAPQGFRWGSSPALGLPGNDPKVVCIQRWLCTHKGLPFKMRAFWQKDQGHIWTAVEQRIEPAFLAVAWTPRSHMTAIICMACPLFKFQGEKPSPELSFCFSKAQEMPTYGARAEQNHKDRKRRRTG